MKQKRLGTIGWLRAIDNPFAKTVAVCDISKAKLKNWSDKHPSHQTFNDYREMVKADLDGVLISTPNWLHTEMATFFMEQGVDVFLEKPMGINRKEIDQTLAVQQATGRMCAIDFEFRVSKGLLRVKEIVESGEIGELQGIELMHHRGAWLAKGNGVWRTDPKRSGGLFFMEICHALDMMRCLMGDIEQVQSFRHSTVLPQYQDMPDNVVSHLWFEGGKKGTILSGHTSSVFDAVPDQYEDMGHHMHINYLCTHGAIRLNCIQQSLLLVEYEDFHPDADIGKRVAFKRREDYRYHGMKVFHDIEANYQAFFKALAHGEPFHQSTLDAWKTHVACLDAERSAMDPESPRIRPDYTVPKQ